MKPFPSGKKHLQAASNSGLFVNGEALPKLAWFEYLSGDAEQSVELLGQAAAHQKEDRQSFELYYRGTILNRLGRYEQARTSLDEALAQRDDLILARQEKGESLWQLGRKEEAISVWTDAVQRNARLALASNQLAGAERSLGRLEEAAAYEKQADQFTPDDPLYHWMLGLRLKNLGMNDLARKTFPTSDSTRSWIPRRSQVNRGVRAFLFLSFHRRICLRKMESGTTHADAPNFSPHIPCRHDRDPRGCLRHCRE